MSRPPEDHRSPVFPNLFNDILRRLPAVLGTKSGRPFVFASTGTGMWEAALMNTLDPGARIIAGRYGQFSHLFIHSAKRLGFNVDVLEAPWGLGAPIDAIHDALVRDKAHEIQGVLVVHNETSTGVTTNLAQVRRAIDDAKHPALLYVDGISSIGSLDFRMDEWGVDLAIAGSQKGFMMPAGLGVLGVSPKAMERVESTTSPRAYFDLRDQIRQNDLGYTPYTPAISLLFGLQEALNMIEAEGLRAVVARHHRLATAARAAVAAWNLELCARDANLYSDTVSAVLLPGGQAPKVMEFAFHRYQISLGAGMGELAGKLFRIGHLGDLNAPMLLGALGGIEMAMRDAGLPIEPGSGSGAAGESIRLHQRGPDRRRGNDRRSGEVAVTKSESDRRAASAPRRQRERRSG